MAIIIKTEPKDYSPVYNDNSHCIFQDDVSIRTKPDYKYLFDIKISDYISGSTVLIRTKVSADPINGLGVQDVGGFVEAYVKENMPPFNSTDSIANTDNAIISYFVEYGEEYRLTLADPVVEYQNELKGSVLFAWGASLEYHPWINFYNETQYTGYLFNTLNQGEFLTTYKTPSVYITDLGWHWYITDTPGQVDFTRVLTYDSAGVLIDTFDIPNNASTAVDQSHMNSVATAPRSLNNITGAFLVGAQPVIISTVASYTVQCFQTGGTAVSELLSFTIDSECFYETFRIHFENKFGGYDSFNFKANSIQTADGERKAYNSNSNNLSSTGITYSHTNEEKINYYTRFSNKIRLESGLISEAQNEWLKELSFTSQAYLEFDKDTTVFSKDFKPVLIKSAKWERKKDKINKTFNFSIEIELADNFKQRR